MKRYRLYCPSIICASCTEIITSVLSGFTEVSVDARSLDKTVILEMPDDQAIEPLLEELDDVGHYPTELTRLDRPQQGDDDAVLPLVPDAPAADPEQIVNNEIKPHRWRAILAGAIGIPLFILSLLGLTLPLIGTIIAAIIALSATLATGLKIYRDACRSFIKARAVTMDSLFTVSTWVTSVVSIISLTLPGLGLPSLFHTGLMILGFRHFGKIIEIRAKHKVLQGLRFRDRIPRQVTRMRDFTGLFIPQEIPIDIQHAAVGDIIVVRAGELIPLDGEIVRGEADIKDTILSGDEHPRRYRNGQAVFAGMELQQGELYIRVSQDVNHSLLQRIDDTLNEAQRHKPRIEQWTDNVVRRFVPLVFITAALSFLAVSLLVNPIMAISTAVAVLSVACPCVFGFLVPLSLRVGASKAAQHGVYFTESNALQDLSKVDTVVLDKTGTLTEPSIDNIFTHGDKPQSVQKILRIAAALEADCEHVIAAAVRDKAHQYEVRDWPAAVDVDDSSGQGISGSIDGQRYHLGNARLLGRLGIDMQAYQQRLQRCHDAGNSALFLVENERIIAMLVVKHRLKHDAQQTIEQLRAQQLNLRICTGSNEHEAHAVARQLGIPRAHVQSQQSPQDKLAYVQALQAQGHKVAMVGDGGNDAPALARAHVGIAMKSGHDITRGASQVILPDHSLQPLVNSFTIAKQTMSNIKQNLAITIGYNTAAMLIAGGVLLAVGFALNPALAAALMILEVVFVLANAYRFKRQKVNLPETPPPLIPLLTEAEEAREEDVEHGDSLHVFPSPHSRPQPQSAKFPNVQSSPSVEDSGSALALGS